MKAIRFHDYGGPEVLRYEDVPQPIPGPNDVRVRVVATSFNPVDAGNRGGYVREAFPVQLPHIPGIDVAGTIDALGANVTRLQVGQAVIGFLPMLADGASAEYVVAPAEILASAPTRIPLADAAALPEVGLTAYQAIVEHAASHPGQRVLISGGGGAIGSLAIQFAKRAGAFVIATASPRSLERVRKAGADEIVDHTTTNVVEAIREPVDVIVNLAPLPPDALGALARLVRNGGKALSTVPTAADGVRVRAIFVRNDAQQLAQLVARVDAGELHVDIAERVPLRELATVHARSDAGTLSGKVIVLVAA